MTDDPSKIAGTVTARKMLAQSEKALGEILTAFELMAERMLDGEDLSKAELSKNFSALGETRSHLLKEVNKHEERVLLSKGLIATAPIDFDAVRSEIGRSLDRLRAASETD